MRGAATVERVDHRLDNRNRPVVGASVGPAFEVVRGVDVPLCLLRGLVVVRAEVCCERHPRHRVAEA